MELNNYKMDDYSPSKIIDNIILYTSLLGIIIVTASYFAANTLPLYVRLTPVTTLIFLWILNSIKKRLTLRQKTYFLVAILTATGFITLSAGLFDFTTSWFNLGIILLLVVAPRKTPFIFFLSMILIMILGAYINLNFSSVGQQNIYTLINKITYFILIGGINYYIIRKFIDLNELKNISIRREMRLNKELKEKLIRDTVIAEEEERKRVAAELHDSLSPLLSTIRLYFQTYVATNDSDKQSIEERLNILIESSIDETTTIAQNLSSHILDKFGLAAAVGSILDNISNINFSIDIPSNLMLESHYEQTIYRICSELINNSVKYASCSNIVIKIEKIDGKLFFLFKDNGVGFDINNINKTSKGMGLLNIKNRVATIGGEIVFETSVNSGVEVKIMIDYLEKSYGNEQN
jgi:signal transduction histidine kinase